MALTHKRYSPDSSLRKPKRLILEFIGDISTGRELAWRLFLRNIKAQYRQSFLGFFWAFIPPLVTTLVWVFLNRQRVFSVEATDIPYPVFVMTGTLLWASFLEALNSPIKMTIANKSMLVKINFPREALLVAGLYEVFFNFAIKLILLLGIFIVFSVTPTWEIIFAPFGVIALVILGMSIGLLLTPLGLLYGDIQQIIMVGSQFLFFLTPIVYPTPKEGVASLLGTINPVSPLLNVTRDWLTIGNPSQIPLFFVVILISTSILVLGLLIFRLAMPHMIERAGS